VAVNLKKLKIDRMISVATLVTSLIALVLVLKKPAPVAPPLPSARAAEKAQSFEEKMQQLEQPKDLGQPAAEVRLSSDEVSAALAQAAGATPAAAAESSSARPGEALDSPNSFVAGGAPEVNDYQVNFDGDVARGQFLTKIGGKDVWVTLSGHLASKDGYATFDPTELKVGDLNIPVSLVNDALQKKLFEQRDRLKLPDTVGGIRVEDGQLVMTQK